MEVGRPDNELTSCLCDPFCQNEDPAESEEENVFRVFQSRLLMVANLQAFILKSLLFGNTVETIITKVCLFACLF